MNSRTLSLAACLVLVTCPLSVSARSVVVGEGAPDTFPKAPSIQAAEVLQRTLQERHTSNELSGEEVAREIARQKDKHLVSLAAPGIWPAVPSNVVATPSALGESPDAVQKLLMLGLNPSSAVGAPKSLIINESA